MIPMHENLAALEKRAANKGHKPSHKRIMDNVRKVEAGVRELEAKQRARFAREAAAMEAFFADRGESVPDQLKMAACHGAGYKAPFIR